jgi:tRNA pseudouridine38-40 synthase
LGGTVKSIDDIKVFRVGDLVVIDFLAREYLWNMVRRMVAALSEVGKGRIEIESVRDSLLGKEACFGLAPAEFLVLMDVMYDFDFEYDCPSTLRRKLRLGSDLTMIKLAFYGDLTDRCRKQV